MSISGFVSREKMKWGALNGKGKVAVVGTVLLVADLVTGPLTMTLPLTAAGAVAANEVGNKIRLLKK